VERLAKEACGFVVVVFVCLFVFVVVSDRVEYSLTERPDFAYSISGSAECEQCGSAMGQSHCRAAEQRSSLIFLLILQISLPRVFVSCCT